MLSVWCWVWDVGCVMLSVWCCGCRVSVWSWVCDFECVMLGVWYWVCDVGCVILSVWFWVCDFECVILSVWFWGCDVEGVMLNVWYWVFDVECVMLSTVWATAEPPYRLQITMLGTHQGEPATEGVNGAEVRTHSKCWGHATGQIRKTCHCISCCPWCHLVFTWNNQPTPRFNENKQWPKI